MTISVTINGSPNDLPSGLNVTELLAHLHVQVRAVAVEINRAIIRRADHPSTTICDGDVIEIVSFVGGG